MYKVFSRDLYSTECHITFPPSTNVLQTLVTFPRNTLNRLSTRPTNQRREPECPHIRTAPSPGSVCHALTRVNERCPLSNRDLHTQRLPDKMITTDRAPSPTQINPRNNYSNQIYYISKIQIYERTRKTWPLKLQICQK